MLLGINGSLQWLTGIPEFDLTDAEARQIASAYADVAKHYPALAIDPKHQAIANLASAVCIPIGARLVLYKMRKGNERQQQAAQNATAPRPMASPPPSAPNGVATEQPARQEPLSKDLRTGEIAGVGKIEFPPDHPLMGGKPRAH